MYRALFAGVIVFFMLLLPRDVEAKLSCLQPHGAGTLGQGSQSSAMSCEGRPTIFTPISFSAKNGDNRDVLVSGVFVSDGETLPAGAYLEVEFDENLLLSELKQNEKLAIDLANELVVFQHVKYQELK
jgi:hypothetical protein